MKTDQVDAHTLAQLLSLGERFFLPQQEGVKPYASADPDSARVSWNEVGVHQNLTFAVQPDPINGMHRWYQKVVVESARPGDHSGDVFVDTRRAGSRGSTAAAVAHPSAAADRRELPRLNRFVARRCGPRAPSGPPQCGIFMPYSVCFAA